MGGKQLGFGDYEQSTAKKRGPPQLLVDPFSGSNSINGATSVIVSNYVDIAVPEPALVVVGSA